MLLHPSAIDARAAKLGVIGLGYAGLPLAALFADHGFDVVGVDIHAPRTACIARGESPLLGDEPGLAAMIARVVQKRALRATTDYADLATCDVIFINVETPINAHHEPEYQALQSACEERGSARDCRIDRGARHARTSGGASARAPVDAYGE
jgi:UDP-N-acetyl-D-mannosaminuronate dehydrogenase